MDPLFMIILPMLALAFALGGGDGGDTQGEASNGGSGDQNDNDGSNPSQPLAAWEREWFTEEGGSGEESHGHFLLATEDGGYLQIGETGQIPSSAKILAVKVNGDGQVQWQTEIGNAGRNLGNSAIETEDGYVIAGGLDQDSALITLGKEDGSILSTKTVDLGGSDALEHLYAKNGKIYAVGYQNAQDPNSTFFTEGQGILVQFDSQGNLERSMSLSDDLAQGYRIGESEGKIIVSGLTEDARDFGVMAFNENLEKIWSKTFGGLDADHNFAMDIAADGSIHLAGHTLSGVQNWDTYTVKLDTDGNLLWERKLGNPRGFDPQYIHDEAWDIKVNEAGEVFVIAGTGDEYSNYSASKNGQSSDIWQVYLIKYSKDGTLLSQETFGSGTGQDWAGEAIALGPEGSVIVGVDNGRFGFLKLKPK